MNEKQRKEQLRVLKAVAGLERKRHFEKGGTLVSWRGGTRTVTADRKKKRNKNKCRQRVHIPCG